MGTSTTNAFFSSSSEPQSSAVQSSNGQMLPPPTQPQPQNSLDFPITIDRLAGRLAIADCTCRTTNVLLKREKRKGKRERTLFLLRTERQTSSSSSSSKCEEWQKSVRRVVATLPLCNSTAHYNSNSTSTKHNKFR